MEQHKGTKQHHKMQRLVCGHKWEAILVSKKQTFRKYGVDVCPNCTMK